MISLHNYKSLLREPHIGGTIGASVVARLPIGMAVISILLFVQQTESSYARAGIASAMYVVGVASLAPFIGRLIDRFGPRPLLVVGACAYPIALCALIFSVQTGASTLWLSVAAFAAGATLPPVSTCVRTLLRRLLSDSAHLQTAYSLDSVLMESVFILGPAFVSLFAALGWTVGAVFFAAVLGSAGSALFMRAEAVRNWRSDPSIPRPTLTGALAARGLLPILGGTLLFSVGFGLFEVSVTAVAERAGAPAMAGVILAAASVGSAAGAFIYGSRSWPLSISGHYKAAMLWMAVGLAALAPLENLVWFCAVSLVAGAPMSIVLAAQSVIIAGIAPRNALAESFTWASTSLLTGVSLGIAAGGLILERAPPSVALLAAALATAAGLLIAILGVQARTP
jgi:MFS family permease